MSAFSASGRQRRRRSDAERSVAAIRSSAIRVLGERHDASLEDIAAAAEVSRQTIYAHFGSREALIAAVLEDITARAVATFDAAGLDDGSATAALSRLLDASWNIVDQFPLLRGAMSDELSSQASRELHAPVLSRLERLIRRGQADGEFDANLSPTWLLAAILALGHAAGQEAGAGHMSQREAATALKASAFRVLGATG